MKFKITRCWMLCKLLVIFIYLTTSPATGQATHNENFCECETMVNGQCAYTLMVPHGQVREQCRRTNENTGERRTQVNATAIAERLRKMEAEMEKLQEWSETQGDILTYVRNISTEHGVELQNLMAASGQKQCKNICNSSLSETSEIKNIINNLKGIAERNQREVSNIKTEVNTIKNFGNEAIARLDKTQEMIKENRDKVTENRKRIGEIDTKITDLGSLPVFCMNQAVLVTGRKSYLPNDQLTASSSYNADHGPLRARINTTNSDGKPAAWCPGR